MHVAEVKKGNGNDSIFSLRSPHELLIYIRAILFTRFREPYEEHGEVGEEARLRRQRRRPRGWWELVEERGKLKRKGGKNRDSLSANIIASRY